MNTPAFQDQIKHNNCFGCGPHNRKGLQIKSYWEDPEGEAAGRSVCRFQPLPHMSAGPPQFLNGGIIATLIDCHAVCTAIAYAYRQEGRRIGVAPLIWYVTGALNISYLKPTPIDKRVELRAEVIEFREKKTLLTCSLSCPGEPCATAEVIAVRVPTAWYEAQV